MSPHGSFRAHRRSAIASTLLFICNIGCSREPARLVVEPPEVDVYRSEDSSGPQALFTLRNTGGRPLKITNIDPRCACTVAAPLEKDTLAPGESVPLSLKVRVPAFGDVDATVVVYSDAPESPVVDLLIHAHGEEPDLPRIQTATSRLELHGRQPDAVVTGEVEVVANEAPGESRWVRGLKSSSPDVSVEQVEDILETPLGAFVQRTYRFRVQGTCPSGGQRVAVLQPVVSDTETLLSSPTIVVLLRCTPALRAIPAELELPSVSGAGTESRAKRLVLVSDDGAPFSILSLEPPPGIAVAPANDIRELRNAHVLMVQHDAAASGGDGILREGAISISTSHVECPSLAVRVRLDEGVHDN